MMRRFDWRTLGVLALLCLARPAVAVDYDVYLLAGQSNMDGRGANHDLVGPLAPYAGVQTEVRIWYSNGALRQPMARTDGWVALRPGFSVAPHPPATRGATTRSATQSTTTRPIVTRPTVTQPTAIPTTTARQAAGAAMRPATRPTTRIARPGRLPGLTFGPEIGFAKTLTGAGLPGGRRLAILKFAASGANLNTEWNPATPDLLYAQFVPFARAGLTALKGDGDTVTIRGFVWHQGESDAALPPEQYQRLLTELIAAVRRDFDAPGLPVYLGEPYDNGRRLRIRAAQLMTAKAVGNVYVVGSVGLAAYDGAHFDAQSQIELGRRFATAVLTGADVMPSPMPDLAAIEPTTQPAVLDPP